MLTSVDWLSDYVSTEMALEDLVERLTMSGLNHDGTETVGEDTVLDLEVTSNRPDCLGHIGIAREIAALFELPLTIPDPQPPTIETSIDSCCRVTIKNPEACYRYTARLIKGVTIGVSPDWLQQRLTALGIGVVNNIVDITNYVMFECGQPLHAFDFNKLEGGEIIVRNANANEKMTAIDHREYLLPSSACVIADADRPVAVGGVMGGFDSEVSESTRDVLIEAAYFDQLSVRNTARALNLHSPSSFRFERDIDSAQLDWASRRCCQLILEIAGGELLEGVIDVGQPPLPASPITLRLAQLSRILGIDVPPDSVPRILTALGLKIESSTNTNCVAIPPSWRKDLSREVDLIEEVGRIYGYDKVPDDVAVPMAASHRPEADRVLDRVRTVMTANGFDEAVTASLVPGPWSNAFSPWSDQPALQSSQPMLGVLEKASQNIGAVDLLRRSLIPSLLEVRRINEYRSNSEIELFEIARVYLANQTGQSAGKAMEQIPEQPLKIALVSQRDYFDIKGVLETLGCNLAPQAKLQWAETQYPLFDRDRSGQLMLNGKVWGWLGEVSVSTRKKFGLRSRATVAEVDLMRLTELANLIPRHQHLSHFPPVSRDFNFMVDDSIYWDRIETAVRQAGGAIVEDVFYRETFRDPEKDGAGKKRVLLSIVIRPEHDTLTGAEVDEVSQRIIRQCGTELAATLT